jgi:signal transduction histidine kinase
LLRLMDDVARARSLQEVYASALDCLRSALNVGRASVLVFDEHQVMRFVAWAGISEEYRRAVDGHSPWSPDTVDAAPIVVPDVRKDEAMAAYLPVFEREGIGALAFIPLRFGRRLLGKFMLYCSEPHEFTEGDVAFAEMVAGHIALAVGHERGARRRLERSHRFLSDASRVLATSLDRAATLDNLGQLVVPELADWCVVYLWADDGSIEVAHLAHADPEQVDRAWEIARQWPPRPDAEEGPVVVMRTGAARLIARVGDEHIEEVAQDDTEHQALKALGLQAAMAVPLSARGHTLGALTLLSAESHRIFTLDDLELAQELGRRAGLALDNARLYRAADAARRESGRLLVEAQAAVRVRDEMVAVVSHDLRTPLGTIVSACDLLDLDPPEDQVVRSRASIRRAAGQMHRLLDDLLEVARADAGHMQVRYGPVYVATVVSEVASVFFPVAEERAIELEQSVEPRGLCVSADRDKLLRALTNLVGNAFKFTAPEGRVSIRAEHQAGRARISVSDTGRGIPEEQLAHLFNRYWQGEAGQAVEPRGVGLGLAITKSIVDAHGGTIEVASRVGEGSTFTVVLPMHADSASLPGQEGAALRGGA